MWRNYVQGPCHGLFDGLFGGLSEEGARRMRRPEVPPMPAPKVGELRPYEVRRREHTIVVTALAVSSVVVVLVVLGFWVFFVHTLSDPGSSGPVGVRIDGDTVAIEADQCPQDKNSSPGHC